MTAATLASSNRTGTLTYLQYSSVQITTATTTLVKTGSGLFHGLRINTNLDAKVITVYDALTATGTPLATLTTSGTVPFGMDYDIPFSVGLCIVTSGATPVTVLFR